jgi:mono/diheme cytochrome c family protein
MIMKKHLRVLSMVGACVLVGMLMSCDGTDDGGNNDPPAKPVGDATQGAYWFQHGDGDNPNPGCYWCHCPDASGGCAGASEAPNIQGASYELIDQQVRGSEVEHTGAKFPNFDDQAIADIEAFLAEMLP